MATDWALVTLVSQAQLPILNKPIRDTVIVKRRKQEVYYMFFHWEDEQTPLSPWGHQVYL